MFRHVRWCSRTCPVCACLHTASPNGGVRGKMLITLCYLYLWVRFQRYYTGVIRSALHRLSGGRSGLTFCALRPDRLQTSDRKIPPEERVFLRLGDRVIYVTEPQACEDLSKWTPLKGSGPLCEPPQDNVAFIIEAASRQRVASHRTNVLNWSDCCLPLACRPGRPYRAVAEASLENFSRLGVAFMEDRLLMQDGLTPERIVSVKLRESSLRDLIQQQQKAPEPDPHPDGHHHMDGHHLHLSSCHECLELENSTILSVRYASAENIPDLPDDSSSEQEEADSSHGGGSSHSGKPPNVLVFTGGCDEKYRTVCSVLVDCLDSDRYAVYQLRPPQALSDPWPENTLLLVLATQQTLTPQLQLRFLSYLSQGGKVLGLSSSLCPAGLVLRPVTGLKDQTCSLTFTRADSSELQLSVEGSGHVYVREPQEDGGGEVELWGTIDTPQEREMVIVRVTHWPDSGEAVLCQVHLEVPGSPDRGLCAARLEVLREILSSLGLRCGESHVPPPSPVLLLHTHQTWQDEFLHWLRVASGSSGVLCSRAGNLRLCWADKERPELRDGERLLHTHPACEPSHFRLQTYLQHLRSHLLGHTVLYADVTSSTMDMLDGLLQCPRNMGLIAIATQQTQGKGRGENVWLSPVGGALFTLHLQVALDSRLGRSISFLQHLVALAAVEAVRALPGYQDVDLRLKWPNDIYSGDLVKLGGVLVTSSLTGSTFDLLIGCGFNVSNSSPTVCINDLVQQCGPLEPLTPDQLIARTVTLLETFIQLFQLHGPSALTPLYYSRWLHSGTRVRLWSEDGPEAEVVGLDESGFLQVTCGGSDVQSLQPDGNSFDMMRNLLLAKKS